MTLDEYLQQIKTLKDGWDDKIPDHIVDSTCRPNNYKVRRAWFFLVGAYLRQGIRNEHRPPTFIHEYKRFFEHITETRMHYRLTVRRDINLGNLILEGMIRHIECEIEYLRAGRCNVFE